MWRRLSPCAFAERVNGAWGIVAAQEDRVIGVACFDWNPDGTVQNLYVVFNPDKLSRVVVASD